VVHVAHNKIAGETNSVYEKRNKATGRKTTVTVIAMTARAVKKCKQH
jgi:hypothetical protein